MTIFASRIMTRAVAVGRAALWSRSLWVRCDR